MSDMARMFFLAQAACNGGSSGPSEVVILPETEIALVANENPITTAPNAMPEVGSVCAVAYNGTAYDCPAVAAAMAEGVTGVAFGNTDALGIPGGNANAPFFVALFDTPMDVEGVSIYGMLIPMEEFAEGASVTLSIVQTEGAASGGGSASAGGGAGVLVINMSCDLSDDMSTVTNPTKDKTYAEAKAVYDAGGIVVVRLGYKSGPMLGMTRDFQLTGYMVFEGQEGFMWAGGASSEAGPNLINLLSDDSFNIMID